MTNAIPVDAVVSEQPDNASRISGFDYSAPAELYSSTLKKRRPQTRYKRFATAAEAVRYVVEDIAPPAVSGAYLEIDEARFSIKEIHQLYESANFPLKRLADQNG